MNTVCRRVVLGSASVIALSAAFAFSSANPALAQTQIYGGGATLPAGLLRDLFNCYSNDLDRQKPGQTPSAPANIFDPVAKVVSGTTTKQCPSPVTGTRWFGYAPVGSGNGVRAFLLRNSAALGLPSTANTVPFTTFPVTNDVTSPPVNQLEIGTDGTPAGGVDNPTATSTVLQYKTTQVVVGTGAKPTTGYSGHHYSFSEAFIPATGSNSFACYNGSGTIGITVPTRDTTKTPPITNESRTYNCKNIATTAGPAIQVPLVGTSVNLPFNIPGRTTLNLSQQSVCRIFTGVATNWNDASITADNGGVVVSTQPIIVAVRGDSSGTSQLFANALEAICTPARTGVDWTGNSGPTSTADCEVSTGTSTSASTPCWTRRFYRPNGTDGVISTVASTAYSIGYTSPEVTQPATTQTIIPATFITTNRVTPTPGSLTITAGTKTAPRAAKVQNKTNVDARIANSATPRSFVTPSATTIASSLASATPPTGSAVTDPAAWGVAGQVPNPTAATGYPLVGFTYMLAYSCYSSTSVAQSVRGFLSTITASGTSCSGGNQWACIIGANTFAALPTAWRSAVRSLTVTSASTKISGVSETGRAPQCNGLTGAGSNLTL